MLNLQLRDEFHGSQTPGTVITLRRDDNTGAVQKGPDYILSITYPTADVQTALELLSEKRKPKPIVLLGSRGRGKSHIMALMHHAAESPEQVEAWARGWATRPGLGKLSDLSLVRGFSAISEAVHNHEYPFLWDLLFDRHPKGEYYRGKFDDSGQYYPPRSLLEQMFASQPTVLILDEFQKWFDGLPETDNRGRKPLEWASNFVQNLAELSVDRPDILILVVSVLNNDTDAFQQIHRSSPALIDFSGPTARQDRQKMVLHRLFSNRENIPSAEVQSLTTVYAQERFRLQFPDLPDVERSTKADEVHQTWPFTPELLTLLEDHILLAETAQDKRDLIRILSQVYQAKGEVTPLISPADFSVDEDASGVQSLLDSITKSGEQERLREVAQRNLENLKAVGTDVPHARELISALWMRSMSPGKMTGGTGTDLQLDITRGTAHDSNAFRNALNQLIENSINIHGEDSPDARLHFRLEENPRTRVRAVARNDKLWQIGVNIGPASQMTYPGKDIEHLQTTLRHVLIPETKQTSSRVVVLGPNWQTNPWLEVLDADKPTYWDRPILIVVPTSLSIDAANHIPILGQWLAKHVPHKRNTLRFLLPKTARDDIYRNDELVYLARCSYLTSQAWKNDRQYAGLRNDFDRPLREQLKTFFDRFAILQYWNYPDPSQCVFDIERINAGKGDLPSEVEETIERDLFDPARFRQIVLNYAAQEETVGKLLDELSEPPTSPQQEALPFLGDGKLYERIVEIAAHGDLVLNVNGKWVGRPAEAESNEMALRSMRNVYRTGTEMRQTQLGLPGSVGGATVKPVSPPSVSPPVQPQPPIAYPPADPAYGGDVEIGTPPTAAPTQTSGTIPPQLPPLPKAPKVKKSEENTGINLLGNFEKWGIASQQPISVARVEFEGLTAQQIKQILQRIPAQFRASLEVIYIEEEGNGE